MAGQGFGFALLLAEDGVVGELAFFEGFQGAGAPPKAASGQVSNADGNRAHAVSWR